MLDERQAESQESMSRGASFAKLSFRGCVNKVLFFDDRAFLPWIYFSRICAIHDALLY